MPGPIVRSGPSPQYSDNWAKAFENKNQAAKNDKENSLDEEIPTGNESRESNDDVD